MSTDKQVKLIVTVVPEGITGGLRDDERQIGRGSCATLAEVRRVELLAGALHVEISGALTLAELETAQQYGWRISETKDAA